MSPVLRAPEGGGSVNGFGTDDTLIGSNKADFLYGQSGNDVLTGNKGDDYLEGGQGDDTYVWAPGDGNDTIYDGAGKNVLKIGEGVDPSKVEVSRDGYHLYLTFKDTGEKLTLQYWYSGASYRMSEIRFADGTTWSAEDVNNAMESGTSGSAPFMSPMQLQAALDDFGASTPASLLSMSAMSDAMGPEDYAGAQLRMDVAVAALAFDSADSDKVIDFSAVASSANANALTVSMASENGLKRHFERKN